MLSSVSKSQANAVGESLKINEIFYSIQGESLLAGKPTVFIRTATCNLRCAWCDTRYSFWPGKLQSLDEILEMTRSFGTRYVCLTGGEPLGQKASLSLMKRLVGDGFVVSLETNGSFSVKDVPAGVIKVIDLKCPESGEAESIEWGNLDLLSPRDEIKFVVASRADFDWSIRVCDEYGLYGKCALLFSPVYEKVTPQELAEWILQAKRDVTMQLQMHKQIWGANERGV